MFLTAAKVGGINVNQSALADFMYENMTLEMNVIHAAWKNGCKKLEFLGSSCIYPRLAPQPMPESCLLTSSLEPTNEAYALAKVNGLKEVTCRGDGSPLREFLYVDDLANLCVPHEQLQWQRDDARRTLIFKGFTDGELKGIEEMKDN